MVGREFCEKPSVTEKSTSVNRGAITPFSDGKGMHLA